MGNPSTLYIDFENAVLIMKSSQLRMQKTSLHFSIPKNNGVYETAKGNDLKKPYETLYVLSFKEKSP